jgi:hypothetical protein
MKPCLKKEKIKEGGKEGGKGKRKAKLKEIIDILKVSFPCEREKEANSKHLAS